MVEGSWPRDRRRVGRVWAALNLAYFVALFVVVVVEAGSEWLAGFLWPIWLLGNLLLGGLWLATARHTRGAD